MNTSPKPPSSSSGADDGAISAISIIRQIQSGQIDPRTLSPESRCACVAHFISEGLSIAETAEILRVAERTIARDRKLIRERNAIEQNPELVNEMVGRALQEGDVVISHLRRVARDKETRPSDKIDAERGVWEVTRQLTQILQSLGYLPNASQQINAKLTHQFEKPQTLTDLLAELNRLMGICPSEDSEAKALLKRTSKATKRILSQDAKKTESGGKA